MGRNKRNILLIVSAGAAVCLAAGAAGCLSALMPVRREIAAYQADSETVDTFVEEPWEEPFVNQAALKAFEWTPEPPQPEKDTLYTYTSPEGISFISKSAAWNEKKLEALYQELLQNKHGEELRSLLRVVVNPQEDEFAAATHQSTTQTNTFSLNFPAFPGNFGIQFEREAGVITLYGGDQRTTVESMADSLSHEYGHHYTFYHMFPGSDAGENMLDSEYARLRGLNEDNALTDMSDRQYYYDHHYRYLYEIAAEDYVALMGSPRSHGIADYCDVRDRLGGKESADYKARNAMVQENLQLPMASEQEGLAAYFYSFIDEPMPDIPPRQEIQIQVQKGSKSYDLTDGYRTFVHYRLSWNKAYGDDATYTLVSYQPDDMYKNLYFIRTVRPGQAADAYVGSVTREIGQTIRYMDDQLAAGTRTFIVTAVLPDGTLYKSDPLTYTFS